MARFDDYYKLTKPGIIRGNLLAATAGFLLASQGTIDWLLFAAVLIGTSLIIASACVFNNYIDRDIDRLMERTKNRALVAKTIPEKSALIFGTILGILGALTLVFLTNWLTLLVGVVGFVFYVFFYTYSKRHSVHSTLIGSVSGAVPPVAGYVAVTNQLDPTSLLLFVILTIWQMPHFYAIAVYRLKDYKNAHIPVLSVVRGVKTTKWYMLGYVIAFALTAPLLSVFHYTGVTYLIVILMVSFGWLYMTIKGFNSGDDAKWAKKVFHFSLLVMLVLSLMLSIDVWLP